VADIDMVVLATFSKPLILDVTIPPLSIAGETRVSISSLALTVEVKDHDARGILVDSNRIYVRYSGWHDATEQSIRQRESLRDFLRRNTGSAPYIVNLLWLRNLEQPQLTAFQLAEPNNVLVANLDAGELFRTICNLNLPMPLTNGTYSYGASSSSYNMQLPIDLLTRKILATSLDRKRIEAITKDGLGFSWLDIAGSKQTILRGRGGSGKTVALLRSAYRWYMDDLRVLILTYNTALVADIRRQLTILRIDQDIGTRNIRVSTVHSFLIRAAHLLLDIKVSTINDEWLEHDYLPMLREAIAFIEVGALSPNDITEMLSSHAGDLGWDFICIDEGQDWIDEERRLLHYIYGARKFLVADGRDQLIRQFGRCNWALGLTPTETETYNLENCLRMKSGLIDFANRLAEKLEIPDWQLRGDGSLPGGQVILVIGPISEDDQRRFINENRKAGNRNIDMLYCVDPSTIVDGETAGSRTAALSLTLRNWGYEVWDAVDREERRTFPTSLDQCRIVQFESSRGLEGWTAILCGLDKFFDLKRSTFVSSAADHLTDVDFQAQLHAALWSMIPITRAIDTVVISIADSKSRLGKVLLGLAREMPDTVSVLQGSN